MASADFLQFVVTTHFFRIRLLHAPARPPRVLTRSFPLYLPHLLQAIRAVIGLCSLYEDVSLYAEEAEGEELETCQAVEKNAGRIEKRICRKIKDIS